MSDHKPVTKEDLLIQVEEMRAKVVALIRDLPLVVRAARYAEYRHENQKRKYTEEPYFVHLQEVAETVRSMDCPDEMIAAAYLHDIIEDQGETVERLTELFGKKVAKLVHELTDQVPKTAGRREVRKAMECVRLGFVSPDAQTIKLADMISNTRTIVEHDPDFAKIYLAEKQAVLAVLTKGNPVLLEYARDQIREARLRG